MINLVNTNLFRIITAVRDTKKNDYLHTMQDVADNYTTMANIIKDL